MQINRVNRISLYSCDIHRLNSMSQLSEEKVSTVKQVAQYLKVNERSIEWPSQVSYLLSELEMLGVLS